MLNFPNNPSVGDLYQTGSSAEYKYTDKNYWEVVRPSPLDIITATSASYAETASFALNGGGGGASVTISGSIPSGSKESGSLWWNEVDGNLYIQVSSPTGSVYVPATNTVAGGNYGATLRTSRVGSVWNINHNLNTTTPLVTVYSGSSVMIPETIRSVDANNTQITFNSSVNGSVVLSTGIGSETIVLAETASIANSVRTTLSSANSQHNVLFVNTTNNAQTDAGLQYNPSTNLLTTTASFALTAATTTSGNWISAGTVQAVGIGATTTAPTVPTNTFQNRINYRRVGPKTYELHGVLNYGSNVGGADGNGDYLFTLPAGLQFDLTLVTQTQNQLNVGTNTNANLANAIPGSSFTLTSDGQTSNISIGVVPWDATRYRLIIWIPGSSIRAWGSGNFQLMFNTNRFANWAFTFQST